MTVIYILLAFGAGFVLGMIATALVAMAGDKERREKDGQSSDKPSPDS